VVDKNSIRDSNQRCIVAHGTHNLTVSGNVAFETKGHCFMTEDGGEMDNLFLRNIGANTRAASRLVRSFETDGSNPSTFWISNPRNEFVGNVAAGSSGNGFWFELNLEVRPPTSFMASSAGLVPRLLPLKLFRDNVAHSNNKHGLRKSCRFMLTLTSHLVHTYLRFVNFLRDIPKWFPTCSSRHLRQYVIVQKPPGWNLLPQQPEPGCARWGLS
jgi:hypothetical protein